MTSISEKLSRALSAVAKIFDAPASSISAEPIFVITGQEEIVISSCRSVLSFTHESVLIECFALTVDIKGNDLDITDFVGGSVTISGNIHTVSFNGGS